MNNGAHTRRYSFVIVGFEGDDFWHFRGLFASTKDGIRFLRNPNRSYQNPEGRVVSWPVSRIAARFSSPSTISLAKIR